MTLKDIGIALLGMLGVSIFFVLIVLSCFILFKKNSTEASCAVPQLTEIVYLRLIELNSIQEGAMGKKATKAKPSAKGKEVKKYNKKLADADETTILMKTQDQVEQYGEPAQYGYYDLDEEE